MAIANQLVQLDTIKQNIRTEINNKGGSVGNNFSTYAAAIAALPTGSSGTIEFGKAEVITINPVNSAMKVIPAHAMCGWAAATGLIVGVGFEVLSESVFEDWAGAMSLQLPTSLRSIDSRCFMNWTSLLSVGIPEGVTSIGSYGFYNCKKSQKIELPSTLLSLTTYTFAYASTCKEVICKAITPPAISNNTFSGLNAGCVFKVPAASVDAYRSAANWSVFAARIVAI